MTNLKHGNMQAIIAQLLVSRNQYTEAIDEYKKFIDETSQYYDDYAINRKSEFLYRIALIN